VKVIVLILVLVLCSVPVTAQEIYKWEDEKGVIHYGDKPQQPGAKPFSKEKAPYSNLKEGQGKTAREPEVEAVDDKPEPHVTHRTEEHAPRPSPSMKGAKAWIDRRGDFWLSGIIRNGGKGTCETPGAEVAVIDELGSVDGRFEISAKPTNLGRGEEAEFSGSHFAPIGDKLTWEATPRCNGATGVVDGARKRGTLRILRHRTLKMKRSRTH